MQWTSIQHVNGDDRHILRAMRFIFAATLALLVAARAADVHAEALLVGTPAHSIEATIVDRAGRAELQAGSLRVPLDIESANSSLSVENISMANDTHVAIARVASGEARMAVLLAEQQGALRAVWSGRTDLRGDLGERRAMRIETRDRTGDQLPDIVVGQTREDIRLCGAGAALLFARALDTATMQMRPVSLMPFDTPRDPVTVEATLTTPGPTRSPLIPTLRVASVSSIAGRPEDPSMLDAPRGLVSEEGELWREGRGGVGRGEFVTSEWIARGLSLRALALRVTTSARAQRNRSDAQPTTVWLVGNSGEPIRVRVPPSAPGQRVWVTLPRPMEWSCLSVVLDEASGVAQGREAEARVSLAGIDAYSDVDFGARVESYVAALDEPGTAGDNALQVVRAFGDAALAPLLAAFDGLAPLGKVRAISHVQSLLETNEQARTLVVEAAGHEDATVRSAAISALDRAGAVSRRALAELSRSSGDAGDEVAVALASHADADVMNVFLAALSAEGGSERVRLRQAIVASALRNAEARTALAAWANESAPIAAAAALASSIQTNDSMLLDIAHALVDTSYARAQQFAERYRVAQAARIAGRAEGLSVWLVDQAQHAEEWMQRSAALSALEARHESELATIANAALSDAYPRVRVRAIESMIVDDTTAPRVATMARNDSWPMVRSAALTKLAAAHRGEVEARAGLRDARPLVRAAAIRALSALSVRDAWSDIAPMLQNEEEWPEVIAAGLEFARDRCVSDASEVIVAVLHRGLRPNAWAPDQELTGFALGVAMSLGGEAAEEAMRIATRDDSPASLRGEASRLRASPPTVCTASR